MKATQQQYDELRAGLCDELERMNLRPAAICTLGDMWALFYRAVERWPWEDRPAGHGTNRDWRFPDLDDSHIETMFRKFCRDMQIDDKTRC